MVQFKGARVVPAAEKPDFNQGGLAAANQNLFWKGDPAEWNF